MPFAGFSGGKGALIAAVGLAMGGSACRASVKAKANVNTAEVEDDRKWEVPEAPTPASDTPPPAAPTPAASAPRVAAAVAMTPQASPTTQFYGVTHDLSLATNAPRVATCRCLAVAYGPPSDAKFAWEAGVPAGDHDAVAIAITGDGVGCTVGGPSSRTSIAGVEQEGADIVLVVETVGEGRPVMRGAIAPYPGPNGAITVKTRSGTAYPAASGAGGCRVPMR